MKAFLSVVVYLILVFALGIVMALTKRDPSDDLAIRDDD